MFPPMSVLKQFNDRWSMTHELAEFHLPHVVMTVEESVDLTASEASSRLMDRIQESRMPRGDKSALREFEEKFGAIVHLPFPPSKRPENSPRSSCAGLETQLQVLVP